MIQAIIALIVSVLSIWWVFKGADADKMWTNLAQSSASAITIFLLGHLILHGFRVLRWGLYINHIQPNISNRSILAAANLGIGATFLLPLRLGEFVRPTLINRAGVRFGSAVASIVVERIADGLCSVGMFFIFFSFVPDSAPLPDKLTQLSSGAAIAFGGGLLFLIAAAFARVPVLGMTRRILQRVSPSLADKAVSLIETFLDGLAALGSTWRALVYITLTVVYWGGSGILIWLLAASYQPDIPLVSGLFTIAVLVFAVMIPAGPAFAGTFEVGFTLGFGAFGLDPNIIIVIAVVAHVVQFIATGLIIFVGVMVAQPDQRTEARVIT
ncbi:MAG: flippase-like domain-containing protein [Myxococcales bacterium]|nr:flippase-like domain-containing protein [Myxococcales bacterium]